MLFLASLAPWRFINVVFNTDYPHPDGTWPWGLQRLDEQPIPEESKRRILWDNAARAFRLDA
jgi:predicted TIM-barrel fold metal-dependent hydrolase